MIIFLGLIILVAALAVGAAGVLSNRGSAHAVSHLSVLACPEATATSTASDVTAGASDPDVLPSTQSMTGMPLHPARGVTGSQSDAPARPHERFRRGT